VTLQPWEAVVVFLGGFGFGGLVGTAVTAFRYGYVAGRWPERYPHLVRLYKSSHGKGES
jgi:hypothetical protein